eukprot:UN34812
MGFNLSDTLTTVFPDVKQTFVEWVLIRGKRTSTNDNKQAHIPELLLHCGVQSLFRFHDGDFFSKIEKIVYEWHQCMH